MTEYIERKVVLKIIGDNCPHDKGGYNTEEEMGAGASCFYIRKDVEELPTADVVPKSEYDAVVSAVDNSTKEFLKLHDKYQEAKREIENLKVLLEMKDVSYKGLKELYDTDTTALIEAREKTEVEVAREIFAEIEEIFNKRIAFYTDMAKQSIFIYKHYAETMIENCKIYLQEIAELKKKYTEGESNGSKQ